MSEEQRVEWYLTDAVRELQATLSAAQGGEYDTVYSDIEQVQSTLNKASRIAASLALYAEAES